MNVAWLKASSAAADAGLLVVVIATPATGSMHRDRRSVPAAPRQPIS